MKMWTDIIYFSTSKPIKIIVSWFNDLTFRQLIQNTGWLLSGRTVVTLLGLVATVIRTHALGLEQFGLFSLILAYVALIGQLTTFQSWQALIKYGAEAIGNESSVEFMSQIKLGVILDTIGALTGAILAASGAYIFANWFNWSSEISQLAAIFSISLLFNLSCTPIGILRILNRFELQTTVDIVTGLFSLIGTILAYLLDWGIWGFIFTLLISNIFGNLLLLFAAHNALKKCNMNHWWRAPIKEWKPFVRFSLWTYATTSLDIPVKQLDIIIVSMVMSLDAVGIYKIIKQITQLLSLLADPVYQAIYPQFASMIANRNGKIAIKYAVKTGVLLFIVTVLPALLLAATSSYWLGVVFGEEFQLGALPLSIFLILKAVSISFITIHPLFTAMGFVKQTSIIIFCANAVYLVMAWSLGIQFGIMGLAVAFLIQFSIVAGFKALYISKYWGVQSHTL